MVPIGWPLVHLRGRYTPADLVVGIYTGEQVIYSRGMATRDTWLNALPNAVLYVAHTFIV